MSKRIKLYNRDLRVMAADSWKNQPDSMEQKLIYTMRKELNKISEGKLTEQYVEYLQNDTEKVSIHMLNDDCLKHIFQFLSIRDRVRIEIVCKRWRDLSQNSWYMVKTLDISPSTWGLRCTYTIHKALLEIMLKRGKFFTRINLNEPIGELCNSLLTLIGRLCPNLTDIDFTEQAIDALGIRILANNCKNITKFKLGPWCGSPNTNYDNELKYLFKLHQNIEYLAITGNYKILGKCLLCLPEQTVHTIILNRCYSLQEDHLSMALKKLKNLKHLAINECLGIDLINQSIRTDTGKRTLEVVSQHCKNLKTLELGSFPSQSADVLYNLIHLVNLQVLKITFTFQVTDDFLVHLVQHCRQLSNIDITGCHKVSDRGLTAIATLIRLEKLAVNGIKQFTDDGLKNVCGLKEFKCQECLFSDRGIITLIKSSPQLQLLDLNYCIRIGDATLDVAKDVCSSRTNNVMLKMIVWGTGICTKRKINQEKIPPLLNIDYITRRVARNYIYI